MSKRRHNLPFLVLLVVEIAAFPQPAWCAADPQGAPTSPPVFRLMPKDVFNLPASEEVQIKVHSLIDQLDAPNYKDRETAAKGLTDIGLRVLSSLRQAYSETKSLEARLAIEETVRQVYFNYHVFDENGFLGISMRPYIPKARQPNRRSPRLPPVQLPEGVSGVIVVSVMAKSAASQGGLLVNDVITAVEGESFQESDPTKALSDAVRANRPGTTISLTVIRGANELKLNATLGRTPEDNLTGRTGSRVLGTAELFQEASRRFPAWWAEHFKQSSANPRSSNSP